MSDIEQRLRDAFNRSRYFGDEAYYPDGDLFDVAADHIAALEARNARLEEQVAGAGAALSLACNRLQFCAVAAHSSGMKESYEWSEWANEASKSIRTLTTEQTNG